MTPAIHEATTAGLGSVTGPPRALCSPRHPDDIQAERMWSPVAHRGGRGWGGDGVETMDLEHAKREFKRGSDGHVSAGVLNAKKNNTSLHLFTAQSPSPQYSQVQ